MLNTASRRSCSCRLNITSLLITTLFSFYYLHGCHWHPRECEFVVGRPPAPDFFVAQWWSDDPAIAVHGQLFGACPVRCVGCNEHGPGHAVHGLDVAAIRHVQAEPGAAIKRPSLVLVEPLVVLWPYSHGAALDDIPGIACALNTFLKSHMVGVGGVLPLQ